jgi:hypothetical protein
MCALGAIRDHDDYPRRAGCKNVGLSDQFGVVAWTQVNRLSARLMEFKVMGLQFQRMDAPSAWMRTVTSLACVGSTVTLK